MIDFIKRKKILLIFLLIFFLVFIGIWNIVSGGYDKQNKTILFLKKIIPTKVSRKIRDTIFIIPDLKERNKFLSNIVRKHDQDLNGELFNKEILFSKKNDKKYLLKEFFLPFPRFDGRMGWAGEKNSTKAHHLAIIDDKVIVISGEVRTIYFEKKNIANNKLEQKKILNNIKIILDQNNLKIKPI